MTKSEYFKHAILNGWVLHTSWIFAAFAIPTKTEGALSFGGNVIPEPWGYSVTGIGPEPIRITDAKAGEPLLKFMDDIEIDPSWGTNIPSKMTVGVGNLLLNAVAINPAFRHNVPFITGNYSPSSVEERITGRLKSDPDEGKPWDPNEIYVRDLNLYAKRVAWLEAIAPICCWSATEKAVCPAPGINDFKKKITSGKEEELKKPEVLAAVQKQLEDFDDAYLAGDPSVKFLKGKPKKARKKLYHAFGSTMKFRDNADVKPIMESLDQGWKLDPNTVSALLNDQRFTSYSRGSETVNGGVAGKFMTRLLSGYSLVDTDCGTKLGVKETIRPSEYKKYVGRYILQNGRTLIVENEDQAKSLVGKEIQLRSPRTCKSGMHQFCRFCGGEDLFRFKDSLVIPGTEISATILASSMALMHNTELKTVKLELDEIFF